MYLKRTVTAGEVVEITKYHTSRYKPPFQTRRGSTKKTNEQQWKINEKNSIDGLRLLILNNFKQEDIRLDLTYAGEEPDEKEATRRINNFLTKLRRHYHKEGQNLKWVLTTELDGHRIHHHLLVNNIGWGRSEYNELWPWANMTYKSFRYYDGAADDAARVATYFVKETRKTFVQKDRLQKSRYRASRNLKKPKIEKEVIQSKTWREPKAPKGYYIEKPIIYGNTAFGYPYMFYRLIKLGGVGNSLSHQKKPGSISTDCRRNRKHHAGQEEQMHGSGRRNQFCRSVRKEANGAGMPMRHRKSVRKKADKV